MRGVRLFLNINVMYFELENDDMESSKRRSTLISLIFILKILTKPYGIRKYKKPI